MSVIKKLAGQTAIYGVSSIVGRLLNYFLVPIHTHFFTTDAYGEVSEFYAYVAFFVVLLTFGMETTFFRFVNKQEDKERTFNQALSIVLILAVIFLANIIIFQDSIAELIGYPSYGLYVLWFGCVLAFDAVSSVVMAKLRYLDQPKRFAFIQLVSIGVNIALNLFFLFFLLEDYPSIGIGFIFLANLAASASKPIMLFKELSTYRFVWDKVMAKAMLIFAAPLVIASFAGIVNETLDRILLKNLLLGDGTPAEIENAKSQVGIYSANYKLSILITLFIQAFRYAAEPFFFAQEKNEDKDKVYSKVMTWFVIVVALMFLVISLNLDIFKWFIPNTDYHVGLTVVPILLLANVCLGIYYNQSIWYKLANKTIYGAYIAIGGAIITITLNVILVPILGYEGSAWTTLVCYAAMMVASYMLGKIHYPIKYNLRKVGLYLIAAVVLYCIGWFISFDSMLITSILRNILILIFIGLVFYMERPLQQFSKKEID